MWCIDCVCLPKMTKECQRHRKCAKCVRPIGSQVAGYVANAIAPIWRRQVLEPSLQTRAPTQLQLVQLKPTNGHKLTRSRSTRFPNGLHSVRVWVRWATFEKPARTVNFYKWFRPSLGKMIKLDVSSADYCRFGFNRFLRLKPVSNGFKRFQPV